jgi:hypothetical protein
LQHCFKSFIGAKPNSAGIYQLLAGILMVPDFILAPLKDYQRLVSTAPVLLAENHLVESHLVEVHLVERSFGRKVIWSKDHLVEKSFGRKVTWSKIHLVKKP